MNKEKVNDYVDELIEDIIKLANENEKLKLDKQALEKQLSIHHISQQRELLLAYEEFTSYKVLGKKTPRISKQMVEDYLANNCG
jgi:cell division septum initiation protein DivIVA